ncbi:hypothetical protein [Pseudomonas chlororaphis]|uniref:Uncharacterized protein n=1 Tax=Pseudomonas chlororaphis TaxID=587753 RepID=A0A1Q8ETT7_9PSED|nr:hypothetical protein [Pseudomonas chlororaphis]OLF55213.1 hypothetical protein BTN82_09475 [Pseudomonas chlororaphis]
MTTQQVIALAAICAFVIGLFAYAYWFGRQEGRVRGRIASDLEHESTIQRLEASLEFLRNDHRHLAAHAKRLKDATSLQEQHRHTLLQIAESLRIAAETWSAFKTGKKLERDAHRLRNEALALADLLKPTEQEAAA